MLRVGKIVATHGLNGRVVFSHIVGNSNWLATGNVLFIALQKDSRIPFFVSKAQGHSSEEYHVVFEDVDTMESAKRLIGKHVFVDDALLGTATQDTPLLWIGFTVQDIDLGEIGTLIDMAQAGQQWVGTVLNNGKESLIPMVAPLLQKVDISGRKIFMDLPAGILDI